MSLPKRRQSGAQARERTADDRSATASAVEPALDDLLRDAELPSDRGLRETFEEKEPDGLALLRGEASFDGVQDVCGADAARGVSERRSFHLRGKGTRTWRRRQGIGRA